MTGTPQEIRALLQPFLRAVQNPVDFNQEDLFEGREALKRVFDNIDARRNPALADGFGAAQSVLVALIRKRHIEQPVALKAVGSMLDAMLTLMEKAASGSGKTFDLGGIGESTPSAAKQYLRLSDGPASIPLSGGGAPSASLPLPGLPGSDKATQSEGLTPMPPAPKNEHSLGQLLVSSGKISQGQLARALDLQQINGRRLGEVLIAMEAIGIHSLEEALSRQNMLSDCKSSTAGQSPNFRRERRKG